MPFDKYSAVRAGYVALTDCAPLIVAQELGFDRQAGIKLEPVLLKSWTAVRDGLAFEQLECAQMPGALALAMHLGISGLRVPVRAPLMLGHGGNAITVSTKLYEEGVALLGGEHEGPRGESGVLVRLVAEQRKLRGERRIRIGAVHAFSSHNYEVRAWLAHAGIDPDTDVELIVVPRSKMVEALATGEIDGFCVGDPWGQLAVEAGIGHIVATKADLYPYSPEKVLAFRDTWVKGHQDVAEATVKAIAQGLEWAGQEENHEELAFILSNKDYLNVPAPILMRTLSCKPQLAPGAGETLVPRYLEFGGDCLPTKAGALWLLAQMRRWGQAEAGFEKDLGTIFQPFTRVIGADPEQDNSVNEDPGRMAFDGVPFTASDIEAYRHNFAASGQS
ncbi:CmpA/NrtA family ABC transporter substrate-binding protein [Kordiimonas lacus]|uniref:NitT/TauT family transport system ATP-binding protein n=1 Tax=Kordiimonas lacus TaxID=637679 RepID=A0A1G7DQH9_9PROT|nr:CmpA/NrtA family ABC transporter substrate-binding protein [Kordiimonas lacus]SDE53794.1 NitT/TauT family transport system ATP-binding protein [Kordiimonas lacus]